MLAILLSVVIGGAAVYQETNIIVPFSMGGRLELRGYAFFQEIHTLEQGEPPKPFTVGPIEDPYGFAPSTLRIGEIGAKTAWLDSAFYYSEINVDGIGRFNYAGTRTRMELPIMEHCGLYAQSAQTLFRTTLGGDAVNLTLGVKRKWFEADWTFGEIRPVQADDKYFQAAGLHVRVSIQF